MEPDLVAIYALCEPDDGAVRYVGKADDPDHRLRTHLEQASTTALRTHKGRWLSRLKADGLTPTLIVLEWVSRESWQEAERYWIRQMRLFGCDLTNGTDGGEGGYIAAAYTPEAREKRGASRRGSKHSAETRELLSMKAKQRDPSCYVGKPPVRRGVDSHKARLTDELVVELRRFVRAGGTARAWANAHGVTPATASYAATGDTWKHVDAEPPVPKLRKRVLADEEVSEIRRLVASGLSQAEAARRYGVNASYVSRIVKGQVRLVGAVEGGQ